MRSPFRLVALTLLFSLFTVLSPGFAEVAVVAAVTDEQTLRLAAVRRALPSVIAIFPADESMPAGGGSGVVISPDGYALTNFHVVQPCGVAYKCGMADGRLYDAVLVGLDPVGDIALIKLLGRNDFPFSPLGDSDAVRVGDAAMVMGNPFLLATNLEASISWGIISGVHRYQFPAGTFLEYTDCLQTDAAVNPGNSGGPLFDGTGTLIGINGRCSFEKRGRINVGIGYAVSSNQVRNFLGDLKSGRVVDHASLGAVVSTGKDGRIVVNDILTTCDAYRQGLRWDEEVLRFAGRTLDSANTFKNVLGIFPSGWRVPMTVRGKDSQRRDLLVRLTSLHSEAELLEFMQRALEPPIPPENPDKKDAKENKGEGEKPGDKEGEGEFKKVPERPVPDFAKPYYEKQRGYANYHFNRLERDRVLAAWKKNALVPQPEQGRAVLNQEEPWTLAGRLTERPENYAFTVDSTGIVFKLPVAEGKWTADAMLRDREVGGSPIPHYQQPLGSGGLFSSLWLVQRLATSEKLDFGEVHYLGTAPLGGDLSKLYDVIGIYWGGNAVRMSFDPTDGRLVHVETSTDSMEHPSELTFHADRFEVHWGPIFYGSFDIGLQPEAVPAQATASNGDLEGGETKEDPAKGPAHSGTVPLLFEKMVKIYGAGGGGLHGYQSGCLVSPDGHVLTVLGSVLEADPVTVVLANGRRCEAVVVDADPVMEIALLKVEGTEMPHFNFLQQESVSPIPQGEFGARFDPSVRLGDRVLALSNTFNIAQGAEDVSVQHGVIAARTSLHARRGAFATPYRGPVYIVDFTTNNPGAAGGVLVSREDGSLVGLLGKELRNAENNTWINFVLPRRQIAEKLPRMLARDPSKEKRPLLLSPEAIRPEKEILPSDTETVLRRWGLLLMPDVATRTPPFIDSVRAGSEAEKLGIRPDDLVVLLDNRLTPSRAVFERLLLQAVGDKARTVTLTIERDAELIDLTLPLEP